MIKRVFILALLSCALMVGQVNGPGAQVTSNSVTVTVSRNASLQPDQILLGVVVESGLNVTRDQILAALQGSGITPANFQTVSTVQHFSPGGRALQLVLAWGFSLPVTLSNLKSTVGLLSTIQANIAKNSLGLTMSFGVQGTQVSPQLQQSVSCAAADLIADARARAQKMAAAAGQPLGTILAMSSASVATDPVSGIFSTPTYLPVCSLTAKFALGTAVPLDSDTLAIAASRTLAVQPDRVVIGVTVNARLGVTLADIVSELQGTGITASNFVNAYGFGDGSLTQWSFSLAVPFAKLGDTLASLAKLQQSIGGSKGQPDLTYSVQGTQVSPELQASQSCSFSTLVTDAQAQAQKLASAAGITLGPVVSVSDGGSVSQVGLAGLLSAVIFDPVTGVLPVSRVNPAIYSTPAPPCALTVQFKMVH